MMMKQFALAAALFGSAAFAADPLEGTWKATCFPAGSNSYGTQTMSFSKGSYKVDFVVFEDAACTSAVGEASGAGQYTIGGAHGEGTAIDAKDEENSVGYAIFKIETNTLFLSDMSEKAAARPTKVNRSIPFVRQ